jgi:5-methylcytosine-specific restriction endonuclease McrA
VTRSEALSWGKGNKTRITSADFPPGVLRLVEERLGHRSCVECRELGLVPPANEPIEVDHLQALARGGTNHHQNLTFRCRSHNRAKGDRSANEAPRRPRWERRKRA